MQVSRRGKFNTLVHKDGSPIQAELYNCIVQREPHDTRGKTYATLDLTYARGAGVAVLQYVDARIRKEAAPEFSPLRPDNSLVVKVPEFPCRAAVGDPTHVRYFVPESFFHLCDHKMGHDTGGLKGLFDLAFLESRRHDRPSIDRGQVGSYFTELHAELIKLTTETGGADAGE